MATMLTAVRSAGPTRQDPEPDPEVPARARMRRFGTSYKQRILSEYEGLGKAGKGALLRREGLYSSLISEWRKQRDQGALAGQGRKRGRPETDPRDRELARLGKELAKVERELDKARQVIEIQSKLSALLEGLAPEFPDRFGGPEDARAFCTRFFPWYNDDHRHSGLGYHTPADVHHGRAGLLREHRAEVLTAAYAIHPERFVRKPPAPPRLPMAAWINRPPQEVTTTQ